MPGAEPSPLRCHELYRLINTLYNYNYILVPVVCLLGYNYTIIAYHVTPSILLQKAGASLYRIASLFVVSVLVFDLSEHRRLYNYGPTNALCPARGAVSCLACRTILVIYYIRSYVHNYGNYYGRIICPVVYIFIPVRLSTLVQSYDNRARPQTAAAVCVGGTAKRPP